MPLTTSVPHLISQQFDNEVVLANHETGVYYNLDGSAAQIWLGIQAGRSVDEIAAACTEAAAVDTTDIAQQVRGFVDGMLAEGLVATGEAAARAAHWAPQLPDGFAPPQFERFDNLRELLLMDPVHDAGDQGWPLR